MRFTLLIMLILLATPAFSDWQRQSDNPLIALGLLDPDAEFEFPDEITVTETEISKFAVAYVDMTVAANRASARMALGQEIPRRIIKETTHRAAEILVEAGLDVERYRILEGVVNMEPRIFDDMVRHAHAQREDKLHLLGPPEDFHDFKNLLEGEVSYEITQELFRAARERMTSRGGSGNSAMPGMLQ